MRLQKHTRKNIMRKIVLIISILLFVCLIGCFSFCFDISNLPSDKIISSLELVTDKDFNTFDTELYKNIFDFDSSKIVYARFRIINKSFYKLRNVKLEYGSDLKYEVLGRPELQEGEEVIVNPKTNRDFVVSFVIDKHINDKYFVDHLDYRMTFSVVKRTFSLTNASY